MFTISQSDFSNIHNGTVKIGHLIDQMEEMLNPQIVRELRKSLNLIKVGFEPARRQESENFRKLSDHYNKIQTSEGFISVWSMYNVSDLYAPAPFNATKLMYDGYALEETLPKQYTWVDLWKAADKIIRNSGDLHHVFIEDFEVSPANPDVLILHTGS